MGLRNEDEGGRTDTCPACCKHKAEPPHTCPFKEVKNKKKKDELCTCCIPCQNQCVIDLY